MAVMNRPGNERVYDAARQFVDRALRRDDSLFTPGAPVWWLGHAREATARLKGADPGAVKDYDLNLRKALEDASPEVVQLVAEARYVQLLLAADVKADYKRAKVHDILGSAGRTLRLPADLDASLNHGLIRFGQALRRWWFRQLGAILEFARAWKEISPEERRRALEDPWEFKSFLFSLDLPSAGQQREALLHLVHPATFEDIVSDKAKSAIAKRFKELVTRPTDDVDRAILQIR